MIVQAKGQLHGVPIDIKVSKVKKKEPEKVHRKVSIGETRIAGSSADQDLDLNKTSQSVHPTSKSLSPVKNVQEFSMPDKIEGGPSRDLQQFLQAEDQNLTS